MSGRMVYFILDRNGTFHIRLRHPSDYEDRKQSKKFERSDEEKIGFVLLECLEAKLIDGTLTKLNIDNGKAYL